LSKILHLIVGLGDGGAESVLFRLCTHDKDNHHIVISMMGEGKYGAMLRSSDVEVYCLNMKRGIFSLLKAVKLLWQIIRTNKPDIIQTWMYHADFLGGIVGRLAGIKRIYWGIRHSNLSSEGLGFLTRIIARTNALLSYFIPSVIISCSKEAVKSHQQIGYKASKFITIPNGYNLDNFKINNDARKRLRNEWGIEDNMPLIGMVARFDPQKDHANLLAGLSVLKKKSIPFRCILIGSNITLANAQLREWVSNNDVEDNIILLGQRRDIPDILNAIDLKVLSSYSEAFPNVLAEAMACGIPCVATDVGDAAFIVGKTGWIVPAQSPLRLAEAISKAFEVMQNEGEWQQYKKAARNRIIDNFDINSIVKLYNKAWKES